MAVTFACEKCHAEYTVADSLAGKKGRCNACGHLMQVPGSTRATVPAAAAAAPHQRSGSANSTAGGRAINFADPLSSDARDIPPRASLKNNVSRHASSDPDDPLASLQSVAGDEDDGTIPFTEEFTSRGQIRLNISGAAATVCIMLGVLACLLPLLNQPVLNAYGRLPVYTGLALGLLGAFVHVQKGRSTFGVAAGAITVAAFFGGVMYKPAARSDAPVVHKNTTGNPGRSGPSANRNTTVATPLSPALRNQLQNLNSFDAATRFAAAQEIVKSPPHDRLADVVRAMEPKLVEDDPRMRLLAIQGVMLQPTDGTPAMVAHLAQDPDRAVRESALRALGKLGGPVAVQAIASRLADDPAVAHEAFAAAQGNDAQLAANTFRTLLAESRDGRLRAIAIDELAARNVRDADQLFPPLLTDADPGLRDAAIRGLGKLKVTSAIRGIAEHLGQSEVAVTALQSFGAAAEQAVLMRTNDTDAHVRAAAARVLAVIATPQNLPAIQQLARDESPAVAAAALDAWKRLVPTDFTPVQDAIRHVETADVARQRKGIEALAKIKPDENRSRVAETLVNVALGKEADLRAPAAAALATWGTRDSLLTIVSALGDSDLLRQDRAKEVLGHMKDPRAIDPVTDLAERGNTAAVDALTAMGPMAEDGALRLLNCANPEVQLAAVRALGEIGTSRSVLPLGAVMRSRPNAAARFEDREALRKINNRIAEQSKEEAKRRPKTAPATSPVPKS
jgi:HEAT repeat protein